ncbi:hypothetical protein, partial [Moraxella lacunata]|uniref:hypothetical protein n=1 Tax=Moraxella lacunata TaxID=477 RepID=UPI0024A7333A
NFQFSIFNFQFSIFNFQFSIFKRLSHRPTPCQALTASDDKTAQKQDKRQGDDDDGTDFWENLRYNKGLA